MDIKRLATRWLAVVFAVGVLCAHVSAYQEVAVLNNGRVFVPAGDVARAIGAEVAFTKGFLTFRVPGKSLEMKIGSKNAKRNGKPIKLDQAPFLLCDLSYVPLRPIAEALGATLDYDSSSRSVRIQLGDKLYSQAAWSKTAVATSHQKSLSGFIKLLENGFAHRDIDALCAGMDQPLIFYDDCRSGDALRQEMVSLCEGGKLKFNAAEPWEYGPPYGQFYSIAYDSSVPDEGGESGFMGNFIFRRESRGYWRVIAITLP